MTLLTDYPWTLNGIEIGNHRFGLETLSNVDGRPGRRHRPRITPGIPGEDAAYGDPLGTKTARLRIYITGADANGAVTHTEGPFGHYQENRDLLLAALEDTDLIPVTRQVADTTGTNRTRTADVYARRVGIVRSGPTNGRLDCELVFPYPYWLDSVLNTHVVNTAGFVALSPAPVTDLWVYNADYAFAAASVLTHQDSDGTDDATMTITGSPAGGYPVTVNPKAGTVLDNAGGDAQGLLTFSHRFWARFRSSAKNFKRSAGNVTITWHDHHP